MKNNLKTRNNNKDILMLSISIFAIIGGTIVFRSFAAKNTDTTNPGTVIISNLEKDSNNSVSFAVKKNLTYCLDTRMDIRNDNLLVALTYDNTLNKYCFTPKKDSKVTIEKIEDNRSELTIF